MTEKSITVSSCLEARPAALFVQTASKFSSRVQVKIEDKVVNAKSIMGMISLGVLDGHSLTVLADGADEEQAVNELAAFLQSTPEQK